MATVWPITLASFCLLCANIVLASWRLCVLLKPCGLSLSLRASIQLTLVGMFCNVYLLGPAGGDAVRIYYAMGDNHGRRTEVATIMLLDRAVGMFALVLWPLLLALVFPPWLGAIHVLRNMLWMAAGLVTTMLVGLFICTADRVRDSRLMRWAFQKLPLGNYAERIFGILHTYHRNVRELLLAFSISLLVQSAVISATLLLAQPANPNGPSELMSILIAFGLMANALPLTVGGLGVGEVVFNKLFGLAGLQGGAEALLGWRMLSMVVSLLGLVFYSQGRKRFICEAFSATSSYSKVTGEQTSKVHAAPKNA